MRLGKPFWSLLGTILVGMISTGCFEVEEWVRVTEQGKATLAMKVRMGIADKKMEKGGAEAGEQLKALGAGMPGVRLQDLQTDNRNGQLLMTVTAEADRLGDLTGFYKALDKGSAAEGKGKPDDVGQLFAKGSFYRVKKSGDRLRIERMLQPTTKAPKKTKGKDGQAGEEMAQMMMGGIFMRFALTVPGKILFHNAETVDGQTLHWVYPFSYLAQQRATLWAEVEATPETERALLGK